MFNMSMADGERNTFSLFVHRHHHILSSLSSRAIALSLVLYPYFWLFLMAKVQKKSEISKSLLRNAII